MKRLSLLLITLCIAFSCKSQQILHAVNFKLPDGSEKLDQKKVESFSIKPSATQPYQPKQEEYYNVEGIKVGFLDMHTTNKEHQLSLEQGRKSLLERPDPGYRFNEQATIETINNMRFLIYRYEEKGTTEHFIRFYTEWRNDYAATGLVRFDKADTDKANKVLNEILSTMKFKE